MKKTTMAAGILFTLSFGLIVAPAYTADTTATETGQEVKQIMQLAPSGAGPATTNNADINVGGDAKSGSVNGSVADSVAITVDPTLSSPGGILGADEAGGEVGNWFSIKSNVTFDLKLKPNTSTALDLDQDGDGQLAFHYTGSEDPSVDGSNADKPLSSIRFNLTSLGGNTYDSTMPDGTSLNTDGTNIVLSDGTHTEDILPNGDYQSGEDKANLVFVISNTQPSKMAAGTYRLPLLWTIEPTS